MPVDKTMVRIICAQRMVGSSPISGSNEFDKNIKALADKTARTFLLPEKSG
jgi:hypothetical protein